MKKSIVISSLLMAAVFLGCNEDQQITITPPNNEAEPHIITEPEETTGNECRDACSEGTVCNDETSIRKCEDINEDKCLELIIEACPKGTVCQDDECIDAPPCEDECTFDECDGENAVNNCVKDEETGCNVVEPSPCEDGTKCSSGKCRADSEPCEHMCDENAIECNDAKSLKICKDSDGDGCREWVLESCEKEQQCSDSTCKKVCENACTGTTECDGTSKLKTCEEGEDGCKQWVVSDCPSGTECTDGVCKAPEPTCQDTCSGTTECDGTTKLKTCEEGEDGCKHWVISNCASGKTCSDGVCRNPDATCKDTCTGTTTCDGTTGYKTCKDTNGDGCKEWSDVTKCASNQTCSGGKCVCKDTCTGTTTCDGTTGYKTCKDTNGDGCKEWTAVTKCASNQTCSGGKCVCEDTCTGTTKCDGTTGYKICKDTNGDGCKEWSAVTKCSSGQTCSGGACVSSCKYTTAKDPGIHPLSGESGYGTSESVASGSYTDEYLYDADNYIKIGVRREWGGSIVFFGLADGNKGTNGSNTIDGNDTGREVQVAIYDGSRQMQNCAHNASCLSTATSCPNSITYLGWNPVQGGNRCNIGSGVDSVTNKNGILEVVTTPLHWNPNWDATDCTSNGCSTSLKNRKSDVRLTQRIRFVRKHVAELFYSVQNLSALSHTSSAQELPTLYAAYGAHGLGNYNRLIRPDKVEIAINEPANDGFYTKAFSSTEPWVTLQNANLDYGVGILYENGLLKYQGWQKAGVFNNVRSLLNFALPANGTVNARAYLILGGFDTVKAEAQTLMKTIPPFGVLDTPADGATLSGSSVSVSGWALDNKGITKIVAKIDETTSTELTYGGSRADVCQVWIGYPKCNNVGFSGKIDVSNLDKNCNHLLEIVATDGDGNTRTIARKIFKVK